MGFETIMFDVNNNLNLTGIFVNSWFFGFIDFGFMFILLVSALLMNRYGVSFGQIVGVLFAMSLLFATMSMSIIMWGIVIILVVVSGLRLLQNILLRT